MAKSRPSIDLRPLNVLIGPNGSGKSNLIEVLGLLQNAPRELATAISHGGPVEEWLWKGAAKTPTASIDAIVSPAEESPRRYRPMALHYRLAFTKAGFRFEIADELIENERPFPSEQRPYIYYAFVNGRPMLNHKGKGRKLRQEDINPQQSILAQRKDPEHYPEITYLGDLFAKFRLYRDWDSAPSQTSAHRATSACLTSTSKKMARTLVLSWTAFSPGLLSNTKSSTSTCPLAVEQRPWRTITVRACGGY